MGQNPTDMRMTLETLEKLQTKMCRIREDNTRLKQSYDINEEQSGEYHWLKPKQLNELYQN